MYVPSLIACGVYVKGMRRILPLSLGMIIRYSRSLSPFCKVVSSLFWSLQLMLCQAPTVPITKINNRKSRAVKRSGISKENLTSQQLFYASLDHLLMMQPRKTCHCLTGTYLGTIPCDLTLGYRKRLILLDPIRRIS